MRRVSLCVSCARFSTLTWLRTRNSATPPQFRLAGARLRLGVLSYPNCMIVSECVRGLTHGANLTLLFFTALCCGPRRRKAASKRALIMRGPSAPNAMLFASDDYLLPTRSRRLSPKLQRTPGMTEAALFVILQTPHRDMPDFIIPAKDKADVVAYILSLQQSASTLQDPERFGGFLQVPGASYYFPARGRLRYGGLPSQPQCTVMDRTPVFGFFRCPIF